MTFLAASLEKEHHRLIPLQFSESFPTAFDCVPSPCQKASCIDFDLYLFNACIVHALN